MIANASISGLSLTVTVIRGPVAGVSCAVRGLKRDEKISKRSAGATNGRIQPYTVVRIIYFIVCYRRLVLSLFSRTYPPGCDEYAMCMEAQINRRASSRDSPPNLMVSLFCPRRGSLSRIDLPERCSRADSISD